MFNRTAKILGIAVACNLVFWIMYDFVHAKVCTHKPEIRIIIVGPKSVEVEVEEVEEEELTEEDVIASAAERNGCEGDDFIILQAIRKAENGKSGREFGVLHPRAVDTDLDTQAGWCAATIVKNRVRWVLAGYPGEFIDFLGARYCPPSAHSLNKNWTKNVKHWFERLSNG